jgi:hypothetical protein
MSTSGMAKNRSPVPEHPVGERGDHPGEGYEYRGREEQPHDPRDHAPPRPGTGPLSPTTQPQEAADA